MTTDLTMEQIEELDAFARTVRMVRLESRGPNCLAVVEHILEAVPQLLAMARRTAEAEQLVSKYKSAVADQLHYDMKAILSGTPEERSVKRIADLERRLAEAQRLLVAAQQLRDSLDHPDTVCLHNDISGPICDAFENYDNIKAELDATQPEPEQG